MTPSTQTRDKNVLLQMLRLTWRCLSQLADPRAVIEGTYAIPWFIQAWRRYTQVPTAEKIKLVDLYPQLHDHTALHEIDPHYFYLNGWAVRRIVAAQPKHHVDIASDKMVANFLGAVIPTTFLDYRPLEASLPGLECREGDILALPFETGSISSLSCLHVAEHIGLGRYGDPLDPLGTAKACAELARVLAPEGHLYFGLPIGRERLCFNAHRVHFANTIIHYFQGLDLVEFSGVDDGGLYHENALIHSFDHYDFGCGFFLFRKRS